jgi:hypothetical protein
MKELHTSIKEALSVFEILRKLGFHRDQIYAGAIDQIVLEGERATGEVACMVIMELRAKDLSFVIQCGMWPLPPELFEKDWADAAEYWNTTTPQGRRDIYENSNVRQKAIPLVQALASKGIMLPCTVN